MNQANEILAAIEAATEELRQASEEFKIHNQRSHSLSREVELATIQAEMVAKDLRALRQEVGLTLSLQERDALARHNAIMRCFFYLFEDEEKELIEWKAIKNKDNEVLRLLKEIK